MAGDPLATRFGQWVVDHPWQVIVATLLVVLAAASGGRFLTFTNRNDDYIQVELARFF